jgi:signal transduction histidine kinase
VALAHEFSNILSVVLSYLEFPEGDRRDSAKASEDLAAIRGAAGRAVDLVRQLSAHSKGGAETGETVDLNEALRSFARLLTPVLGEEVEIVWNLDPEAARGGWLRSHPRFWTFTRNCSGGSTGTKG